MSPAAAHCLAVATSVSTGGAVSRVRQRVVASAAMPCAQ